MKAVAAACLLLLAAAAPARAAEEYCGFGHAAAVLMVDRTTRFDATDRSVLLDAAATLLDRLGPGDRLIGFTISGDFAQSRKFIDACKPACPQAGFFAELLATCSPVVARARYRQFQTAFARQLADMLRNPEETTASDIFRTIAEDTRAVAADDAVPLSRLVIFSDLLENSAWLPERELRTLPEAEVARRVAASGLRPALQGAAVRVFGFGRDDAPGRPALPLWQHRTVQAVWEAWFRQGGAAEVQIGFR